MLKRNPTPRVFADRSNPVPAVRTGRGNNAIAALLLVCLVAGCHGEATKSVSPKQTANVAVGSAANDEAIAAQVASFCGACHVTPDPSHFPRAAWRDEVEQGFHLYFQSDREGLQVPIMADVIRYYEDRAPVDVALPMASSGVDSGPLQFRQTDSPRVGGSPSIAHLNWTRLDAGGSEQLIVCDMKSGTVQSATLDDSMIRLTTLATLNNPAHAEPCDLDGDGRIDLVVADLGSFAPADHNHGRVVWLRKDDDDRGYTPIVLCDKLGRVADVQAVDSDADGDVDLMVAEFGWRKTGRLLLLENLGGSNPPQFEQSTLDPRHGAIHVVIADLNQDGRPDATTLFSQDHETITTFFNLGQNRFEARPIFAADRPSFGSSGISPVDLDRDGDTDFLYTNGDMFDDYLLRDYHAVHWMENLGENRWQHRKLAELPGVHRALAADLDLDGDLDIVACSLIPAKVIKMYESIQLDSLIWLEQTSTGVFERHVLEQGKCRHATMAVADLDQDGDMDLAVGNYSTFVSQDLPALNIWWNLGAGNDSNSGAAPRQ